MLFLFFRGRYGPALRALAGIAIVIYGIADSTPAAAVIGCVLIVWGEHHRVQAAQARKRLGCDRERRGRMTAIMLEHVTKRFGDFAAVDDVSFGVPDGQLLAVLGPNGAGKTTTLEMLEGFLAPTSGTVRVLGADPRHGGRAWRARVGLVLQSTSLDPELTVRDTLNLYAPLYPNSYKVNEALELVELTVDAQTRVGGAVGRSVSPGRSRDRHHRPTRHPVPRRADHGP